MEPISDVLRSVRLSGAHFFRTTATGAWSVAAPSADRLTPRILPGSQHLISYHLVLNGICWGGIAGEPLVPLAAGDVIVFPHGHAHLRGSAPQPGPELISVEAVPRFPQETTLGDPARADVTLVCGFFGCDR